MGFQTPLHELKRYLEWTTSGHLQLPDFQRGYKWDDERIRQLLITVLRGHPLGVVMLLDTGNEQIRFKPRPVEGRSVSAQGAPKYLLLDGQQRLTSMTQALTGDGIVDTTDARGKLLQRRYYLDMRGVLDGEDAIDEAVLSVPGDGVVRTDFGRKIELDLSTPAKEQAARLFPLRLLFSNDVLTWLLGVGDSDLINTFNSRVLAAATTYTIPAIELDSGTSKAAVATVFEKVNTGGLPLNVFELLTAVFAGDRTYYEQHGTDFRLNDDWHETQAAFGAYPVLRGLENTDFLQAVTLLATHERALASMTGRAPAVSAKREDVLKLTLADYLKWVGPLRKAFIWASDFLADRHIFDVRFLPYPKQVVPLAAIRVIMGSDADLIGPRSQIVRWFWCGIMGELYGSTIETRFVRDVQQVPAWASDPDGSPPPNTVQDATFVESRLWSLRTRNAAAYKGIYALLLGHGAVDWMEDKALDKVQYTSLAVDIHHIFPKDWCEKQGIEAEMRESIVNKTPLSARTNRVIGGVAPSRYMSAIEKRAGVTSQALDTILQTHLIEPQYLRANNFYAAFGSRAEGLCRLVEKAMGKIVPRDVDDGHAEESSDEFTPAALTEEESA